MLSRVYTATTLGLEAIKIEVEVDANRGQPAFIIIGLPSKTIDESKERISSSLRNCGIRIKSKRTIVNLAPADIKKNSSLFELAITVGILKMYGDITQTTDDTMFFGELSLDGELKKIRGALPLVLAAKQMGFTKVVLPQANAGEVAVVSGISIYCIAHLQEYLDFAKGKTVLSPLQAQAFTPQLQQSDKLIDFADVHGQEQAKRALEIAAAGGHNILLEGTPGAGKSMMARALAGILPPLTKEEAIEITKIYSVCGLVETDLIRERPFRSPHHSTSAVGLIGGGSDLKPGEISLAHRGILFLDEFPEFSRVSLEGLRQPLEDGYVTISRAVGSAAYPSSFTLVAAANPCPCGFYGSEKKNCVCSDTIRERYRKKLSGPILDRIDLYVHVDDVEVKKLAEHSNAQRETSTHIRERISRAADIQHQRLHQWGCTTNAELSSKQVKQLLQMESSAKKLLEQAIERLQLSARSYFKTIKIAQTIADLAGEEQIVAAHIAEALQYRKTSEE